LILARKRLNARRSIGVPRRAVSRLVSEDFRLETRLGDE
jgi:hypothetical protein